MGDGGAGGTGYPGSTGYGYSGAAGAGGAGGGSGGPSTVYNPAYGGPVGLRGMGANGAGGVSSVDGRGGAGSNLGGVLCGGGGFPGNLRWLNDIPVTPGETLTINLQTKLATDLTTRGFNAGCRIIWGNDGRSLEPGP